MTMQYTPRDIRILALRHPHEDDIDWARRQYELGMFSTEEFDAIDAISRGQVQAKPNS